MAVLPVELRDRDDPVRTTDSHGKNWSSSLVVICLNRAPCRPPSVDFETRTSVFVSAVLAARLPNPATRAHPRVHLSSPARLAILGMRGGAVR
jgi:hypothetical protein